MTTSDLRYGYSEGLRSLVNSRTTKDVVTRFAKHCIANNISASEIADKFGVSRQTVYAWFKGAGNPTHERKQLMLAMMRV